MIRSDSPTIFLNPQPASLFAAVLFSLFASNVVAQDVEYNKDIRPILARNCFACHGRDENALQGDLRLDVREAATKSAIVPGKPHKSELFQRITSNDPDRQMPPPDSGHRLTSKEIDTLKTWIKAGAQYEEHWAFVAPTKPATPKIVGDWPLAQMDKFVLKTLQDKQLSPTDDASKPQWLRRVSLDITGLPPTLEELEAFNADNTDQAHEKVVDRLLQSDAYGEHWARMWLDLARYADTKGYEKDRHRDIWRYRDWVINAFNRDMPFDQFTIEQLAGDLLNDQTTEQILATAFHRNTMTNEEGGTDNEEFRVKAVKDRVDTTLQVWMGLTAGCAKCHSHKYDPISLNDYYSFYAFFNQTQDNDTEGPFRSTPNAVQQKQLTELQSAVTAKKKSLAQSPDDKKRKDELKAAEEKLKAFRSGIPKTPVMLELDPKKQRTTRIHNRGNFLDQGEAVTPDVLSMVGRLNDQPSRNRLDVANWLMHPKNPLTARVTVNRIWARLFGIGLVETEEDFGTQGLAPSHPELLDWLAIEFREQGWSIKSLIRTIVLSRTYRQSSATDSQRLRIDPRNRLLSRGPRFRLPAETVRDQALAVSGLLSRKVGGKSVMPPQPDGVWKSTYNGDRWKNATGEDRYRRGLYTYLKRTSPYPAMTTFDAGSGEVCQIRRVRTNTPLQALVTLNDTAFVEAAGALAAKMEENDGETSDRLKLGFRRVLIRDPSQQELDRLLSLYESLALENEQQLLKSAGRESGDARMVAIANVLLNLDEVLMKP